MPRTGVPGQSLTTADAIVPPPSSRLRSNRGDPQGRMSCRSVCTAWKRPSSPVPVRETPSAPTDSSYPPAGRACRSPGRTGSVRARTTRAPGPGVSVIRRVPAWRSSSRRAATAWGSASGPVIRATSSGTATGAPFARSDCGRGQTERSGPAVSGAVLAVAAGPGGADIAAGGAARLPATTATARAAARFPRRSPTGPLQMRSDRHDEPTTRPVTVSTRVAIVSEMPESGVCGGEWNVSRSTMFGPGRLPSPPLGRAAMTR